MYTNEIKELNKIWHVLIAEMQNRYTDDKCSFINELSTIEISVLQILHDTPNVILKDICSRLNIPKSTLTSAVNRLVSKGYVKRISASNDKRAFSLYITEAGTTLQKKHLELEHSVLSRLITGLSPDEITTLVRLLKKAIGGDSNE